MKNLWIICLFITACSAGDPGSREILSLEGNWGFRTDPADKGLESQWYSTPMEQEIHLPGSMAEYGYGEEVSLSTPWTGSIWDSAYFKDPKYEQYRQPGNMKIPFWLKPVKYYQGPAWYRKEVEVPEEWSGKRVFLHLERCHWETRVFVNGVQAGKGISLSTPHEFDLTSLIRPGLNVITLRVDNRMIIPVGINSHSVSDHTQTNWNGIVGKIHLEARNPVYISDVQLYPDLDAGALRARVVLSNPGQTAFEGSLQMQARNTDPVDGERKDRLVVPVRITGKRAVVDTVYPMGKEYRTWSEFNPYLYRMEVTLNGRNGGGTDFVPVEFGMRDFRTGETRFLVNGQPVFLRGTVECCIFPLTGYPPTDRESWEKLLNVCREHGLNHLRFHSWCPPEAAFEAADRLGFYFQVECGSWANQGSSIGDGTPLDSFIYREGDRILKAYGNHPSFCMMAYGNEPAGRGSDRYLGELMDYWRAKDNRRVYTAGAGWPLLPGNDFHNGPQPRIQQWGAGLESIINGEPPQTMYDFGEVIAPYRVPFVSHEIGQWCVYPDFSEIEQYTGVLKPTNFEIFRETLEENHMGDQARDFLMASGKLQALCYKAETEAALRTHGLAGFQLLQLHDFPGQGTALVGILNPFFKPKGYVTAAEFRASCSETVPLARMQQHTYTTAESFSAEIEVAHFGESGLVQPRVVCQIKDTGGSLIRQEEFSVQEIPTGGNTRIGSITLPLGSLQAPARYRLSVSIDDTPYANRWDFWVYPEDQGADPGEILITEKLDRQALGVLAGGGSVLLLNRDKVEEGWGGEVEIGFSSIFWNTAWTGGQAPHTLGILCDPDHPVFNHFTTSYHSDWQWWDPVTRSRAMRLDHLPGELRPLIQPIDTWFENRRLGLLFEARVGGGKLMVCSIDLTSQMDQRPVARQLLYSVLEYMKSAEFDPAIELDQSQVMFSGPVTPTPSGTTRGF